MASISDFFSYSHRPPGIVGGWAAWIRTLGREFPALLEKHSFATCGREVTDPTLVAMLASILLCWNLSSGLGNRGRIDSQAGKRQSYLPEVGSLSPNEKLRVGRYPNAQNCRFDMIVYCRKLRERPK